MAPPNAAPHSNKAADYVFVHAYHDLPGISEGEWVEYYHLASLERLRDDLTRYLEHQLDLFSRSCDYEEYFSLAEYDDPEDALAEAELTVFRSSLSAQDREAPLEELHALDVLRGYRAVMLQRISAGDLDDVRSAVELFNGIIESAIGSVDEHNPRCYISIETAREFGPWFVAGLLGSIKRLEQAWRHDAYDRFVGERFKPLQPVLELLQPAVQHEGWPHSDISLGRLLLIVDYFKKLVEEDWRF